MEGAGVGITSGVDCVAGNKHTDFGRITDRSLMDARVESLLVTCGCCDVDAGIFVDLLLGYERRCLAEGIASLCVR